MVSMTGMLPREQAMEGDQRKAEDSEIYEATAGWDSYVSALVAEKRDASAENTAVAAGEPAPPERRRKPRDRAPSRRRSLLLSGKVDEPSTSES